MARLRPARTCRNPNSQAWARYSLRKPRKNYVRALPHSNLVVFKTGVESANYNTAVTLQCEQIIQLRSNSLEAARIAAGKFLESNIPNEYWFTVSVYPHNVIREHRMATGAGADRISQGMKVNAFGRPVSVAARVRPGQSIFLIKINSDNLDIAKKALKRAKSKLSGRYSIATTPIVRVAA
jgi:large subunit ribosomal protein L10e